MSTFNPILIAVICLTILTVMVDKWAVWTQTIAEIIPWLPDKYHWTVGYTLVFMGSLFVCWRLQFNLFAALEQPGITKWDGMVFTALVMSGGSNFLATIYERSDKIPGVFRGMYSTFTSVFSSSTVGSGSGPEQPSNNYQIGPP